MLNENIIYPKEEKKSFPPLPKNIYQVELLDISEKDAVGKYAKPGDKTLAFQFTLLNGTEKGESLRGRNVWDNFVHTSIFIGKKGKNSLWQIVEAYLKRELTQEEEARGVRSDFLNKLIGKQIKIFVDQKLGVDGKTVYNFISSYLPSDGDMTPLTAEEKDKATVKKEKSNDFDTSNAVASTDMGDQFLNQEYPPMPEENEIKVENIPF